MRGLMIAALVLAGCASVSGRQLDGGPWRAVDINGDPVPDAGAVTLTLDGGRVSGRAGCNNYSGSYDLASPERIRFSAIGSTRMACASEAMERERRFLAILGVVQSYSFYGDGSLSLIAADGRAIRFRR